MSPSTRLRAQGSGELAPERSTTVRVDGARHAAQPRNASAETTPAAPGSARAEPAVPQPTPADRAQSRAGTIDRKSVAPPHLLPGQSLVLPRALSPHLPRPAAAEHAEARQPPRLELRVLVAADGSVANAELMERVGEPLARAALRLVKRLRFAPATRAGQPLAALVRLALRFAPETAGRTAATAAAAAVPAAASPPGPASNSAHASAPPSAHASALVAAGAPIELTIHPPSRARQARESADAVSLLELDAAQREGTDTAQVIARQEGVTARRSGGLGSAARVSMNGFTDGQVRIFLDGLPLEAAGFPFGLASVPLTLIDHIEVYRGGVPIRLGSDALGGAIALWSSASERMTPEQRASYRVGSFDTHRLGGRVSAADADSGWFGALDLFLDRARNDYAMRVRVPDRMGRVQPRRAYRRNDDYAAQGALLTLGIRGKPWAEQLSLRGHFTSYDKGIPHNLLATVPYGEVRRQARSVGLQVDHTVAWSRFELETRVLASWRRNRLVDQSPCTYDWFGACVARTEPGEVGLRARDQRVAQPSVLARLHGSVQLAPQHAIELSFAPSLFTRSGHDTALARLGQLDALRGDRSLMSWVAAASYHASLSADRLRAQGFAKYYGMRARAEELRADGEFAARDQDVQRGGAGFGLRFDLGGGLSSKLSYEWATRLPSPEELFGDAVLTLSNLRLRPERSHNLNASVGFLAKQAWGKAEVELTAFGRLADALIAQIVGVDSARYENIGSSRALGLQSHLRWSAPADWFAIEGSFTYQDLRNTSQTGAFASSHGDRLPNRPYLFGSLAATTRAHGVFSTQGVLSLTLRGHFVHAYDYGWSSAARGADKPGIPGQRVASVVLTYSTRLEGRELNASLEVQNLTDAALFDNLNVQLPGRAAYATVTAAL